MKCSLAIQQSGALRGCPSELDGRFYAFASRAAKERLRQSTAGERTQPSCELTRQLGNMTLQHRRARTVQLLLQCFNDVRVIVAGVVYAIARKKIQIARTIFGE